VRRADNLTTFLKSGSLILLETSGLIQDCTGIDLLYLSSFFRCELYSCTVSWQVYNKAQCGQRQHCWVILLFSECWSVMKSCLRLRLKCDGTRAETRFRLWAKRTSQFKSAGASVQSTTGSRGVRISGSNAGYTMFRGSEKGTGYPLHSPVSPSLPVPCVTVCHHVSTGLYHWVTIDRACESSLNLFHTFHNIKTVPCDTFTSIKYLQLCCFVQDQLNLI
jgi:hypothetical protein